MENERPLEEELPEDLVQMLNAKQENGVYAGNRAWKNLSAQKILFPHIAKFKCVFASLFDID